MTYHEGMAANEIHFDPAGLQSPNYYALLMGTGPIPAFRPRINFHRRKATIGIPGQLLYPAIRN